MLDVLGSEIVAGILAEDDILNVESVRERFGVSRTVVRETLRSLGALGLVRARSKVGTQVNNARSWALLNPAVIRWRASSHYRQQMIELLQVRRGVEATAARLAALHASDEAARGLVDLSDRLAAAAESNDGEAFLEADTAFHRLLLEGSGNQVIAQFALVVTAALRTRDDAKQPLVIDTTPLGIALHTRLARAIASRDAALAERLATEIADTTLAEFS
ncbi:FCD domain-containing protein [Subtercola sp. PAMC28395]|uniref:FadR/GntR family transcriptional regulator n=1 Tax=Subtercola sp. PAMC28395 TaxID=2846775 RepID=UPI001C0E6111|nr:FCD domain-containing protein [Subtercola sp. PAMC28395]QWT22825.1 FCD domain-containing protein [Subtercola sp. PAMC28395]